MIALTAKAMPVDVEQALASGMNDHIAKPVEMDEVFDKLTRWIHRDEDRVLIQTP